MCEKKIVNTETNVLGGFQMLKNIVKTIKQRMNHSNQIRFDNTVWGPQRALSARHCILVDLI